MNTVQIANVVVPENRIRRKFDEQAIQDLATSLESIGLLQPIVLRPGTYDLLAGERRLRAARSLDSSGRRIRGMPPGVIPFVNSTDLSADALLQAELEENILRKDLTWQEVATATDQLHKLRMAQNPGVQTMKATAQELGLPANSTSSTIRDNVIIASHLGDPDVAQAKDKKQALKVISKKMEQKFLSALGKSADLRASKHTLFEGSCVDFLPKMPSGQFPCIITDPPYGIAMKNQGQALVQHNYEDSPEEVLPMMEVVIAELYRVAADRAHMYMFCDIDNFSKLRLMMQMVGWRPWRTPLVWDKGSQGFLPRPSHGPRRVHELLIFANKGDKEVLVQGAPDVLRIPQDKHLVHPAQKPVELYEELLSRSCRPGEDTLDPFCGRGTIFLAAAKRGIIATGMELDPRVIGIARLSASGEQQLGDNLPIAFSSPTSDNTVSLPDNTVSDSPMNTNPAQTVKTE